MYNNNIITVADIQAYKPISNNIDALKSVNPFIQEAQEFELRTFLGDGFYIELINQIKNGFTNTKYNDLFNGCIWTNGGLTYQNPGIKPMLVYYAYSRYLNRSNTNSTAFGMVGKINPDSEPISEKTLSRLVNEALSGAKAYENRVLHYLRCNSSSFPLFKCSKDNNKLGGLRITNIG